MRACLLCVLLLAFVGAEKNGSVEIRSMQFNPDSVTIAAGGSVIWTNADDRDHTVSGSGISSGTISPQKTFTHRFPKAGRYPYACSLHPRMKGTIVVEK